MSARWRFAVTDAAARKPLRTRRSPLIGPFQPSLIPLGTIAFLGMAALLGAASGAVFALVGKVAPADKVGAIAGVVGAAGLAARSKTVS